MPEPTLATDLASFLYTVTWLSNSLDPTRVVDSKAVLQTFLAHLQKPLAELPQREVTRGIGARRLWVGWVGGQR